MKKYDNLYNTLYETKALIEDLQVMIRLDKTLLSTHSQRNAGAHIMRVLVETIESKISSVIWNIGRIELPPSAASPDNEIPLPADQANGEIES